MLMTITRPDDWHLHLRDGDALPSVVPHTAARFARAIVMPNLKPPVTSVEQARAYRQRILDAVPPSARFQPLMTLYLTDRISPDEIYRARESGIVFGAKLYPAGVGVCGRSGVTDLSRISQVLAAMQDCDLPLLVHAEVTDQDVDIFDREAVFIERRLQPLVEGFPDLRVVFEHVSTKQAVEFVTRAPARVAATVTAHHLLYNRNAMLAGSMRPHYYCLPVLKREEHREALVDAVTGGNAKFFLGTDSAPHPVGAKESACGCAGCYTAYAALELYAEVFEQAGALARLEGFASFFGADFYGLPRNTSRITLERRSWEMPGSLPFGAGQVIPLRAGERMPWRVLDEPTD